MAITNNNRSHPVLTDEVITAAANIVKITSIAFQKSIYPIMYTMYLREMHLIIYDLVDMGAAAVSLAGDQELSDKYAAEVKIVAKFLARMSTFGRRRASDIDKAPAND